MEYKKQAAIVFGVYTILVIFITYPLVSHLTSYATGVGDELLLTWIQNWVIHSLTTGNIFSLFSANIYYPYLQSLGYSDIFVTAGVLSFIPLIIFKEPIVVINFTYISSLILLGFSIFLLAHYLTKDFFASILAGTLVIFSPAVLSYSTHLQILGVQWVPLAILFFLKFLDSGKTRSLKSPEILKQVQDDRQKVRHDSFALNSKYLAISLLFFLLQMYNSFLPGYFIIFSYLILLFSHWKGEGKKFKKLITKKNIFLILASFVLILPIIIPYFQVAKEFNYARDIRDAIHFALQPEDLLYASDHSRLSHYFLDLPFNQQSQNGEFKPGYLGAVFSLLVLFVVGYLIGIPKPAAVKVPKAKEGREVKAFLTIALTGLILSLGPVLHLGRQTIHDPFPIPLPYALFYYIFPGFQGFRNSARWEMLFILAIAIVIAIVLHQILHKVSGKNKALVYLLLFIGVIAEFNFPMKFSSVPQRKDFPPVYAWLATTPKDTAIIELPIYNWNMWPYTQAELFREYYGTIHFRKTVNGYSGFSPPPWQVLVTDTTANFPSRDTIARLKDIGVDYLIIHTDEYDRMNKDGVTLNKKKIRSGKEMLSEVKKYPEMKLIKQFDNTYVFTL